MPDEISNGSSFQNQTPNQDSGTNLDDQSEKSPLEEAMEKVPEGTPDTGAAPAVPGQEPAPTGENTPVIPEPEPQIESPAPAVESAPSSEQPEAEIESSPATETPLPDTSPSSAPIEPTVAASPEAVPSEPEAETAKAPDTDEFLKSILDDHPQTSEASTPPGEVPVESSFPESPAMPESTQADSQPQPPIDTATPEPAPEAMPFPPAQPASTGEVNPEVSKQDSGSMDGISSVASEPSTPTEASGQPMPSAKPSASPIKLILLIIVAAILVIGGYFAYTLLFAANKSASNSSTSTLTSVTATSSSAISTNDQTRKTDLAEIQQALLNYYAGAGKYPAASTLVYLNTANNAVEKALVPAYLVSLPADPASPTKNYAYKSDGKTFTLSAVLDNTADSDGTVEGGLTLYKVTQATNTGSEESSVTNSTPAASGATTTVSQTDTGR